MQLFEIRKLLNERRLLTENVLYYARISCDDELQPRISWSIKGYNPNSRRCSLCLHEKLEIVDNPEEILLNKRLEVISQRRHRNKYKLKTLVSN